MAVLIKGIEMPSCCTRCYLYDDENNYCTYLNEFLIMSTAIRRRDARCPLVEVDDSILEMDDGR